MFVGDHTGYLRKGGRLFRDHRSPAAGGDQAVHWRIGGDEFLVALPGTDAEAAATEAATLEALVGQQSLTVGAETIALQVSVGVASYPVDADSMTRLVAVADERMYERKARRRDAA